MVELEKKISSIEAARPGMKKTYISPNLLEYGNIAKLTQNGASSGADTGESSHDDDVPVGSGSWVGTPVFGIQSSRRLVDSHRMG